MTTHPIPPRPVRPGTLAVRQTTTNRGELRWAIVTDRALHPSNLLIGYKRGYGESHAGQWVYPFPDRDAALYAARLIMGARFNVGSFVWVTG